ncbi:GntR family transcriptional regulator [Peribacillus frigoritolerans]|uniref:GntR family transcriptional regulator n=1 Tax=Peribacillus frigoritolerans TaxID=450367 RepID=UPI001059A76F|nr:GntR family transcriptional regulator [Peribacillus frigoritolerans]TDL82899.1 GntR family transcriptional regulator [Peribacillus frigoritolerans]
MIEKDAMLPLYYQLQQSIKKAIQENELNPGDMIPSEREYAEKYKISKMTVRQALTNLVKEGLLNREQGKGTFICQKKIEHSSSELAGFSESMISKGIEPSTFVVSFIEVKASIEQAEKLKVEQNTTLYEIKRVRYANQLPIAYEILNIPKELLPDLTTKVAVTSIYDYIEQKAGHKIHYGRETIEASIAQNEDADLLKLKEGEPVLLIERLSKLNSNKPFEIVKSVYRADRFSYAIDMKRKRV